MDYDLFTLCKEHTDGHPFITSVTIANALMRGGIHTTDDLKNTSVDEILKIRNIGGKKAEIVFAMRDSLLPAKEELDQKNEGYLYSFWSGELKVHRGFISSGTSGFGKTGHFKTSTKRFLCSHAPGVVYNSMVWLAERDDEQAKYLLIQYEKSQISVLQEKIESHLNKINILKGE